MLKLLQARHPLSCCRRPHLWNLAMAVYCWLNCGLLMMQGLAVHGDQGEQLSDAALPPAVVQQAFTWAGDAGISCVAFLGDECATLRLTDQLRELHHRSAGHSKAAGQIAAPVLTQPPVCHDNLPSLP